MSKNRAVIVLILLVICDFCLWTTYAAATMKKPAGEDLLVSKCRQQCFLKILSNFTFRSRINSIRSLLTCQQNPECFMCWDYCHVLRIAKTDLAQAMCNDSLFCSKGCRTACDYHRIESLETLMDEWTNNA